MAQRHIMRIDLTASAKKRLMSLGDENGMTQVAMMSRLIEWFSKQSPAIQASLLSSSAMENPEQANKMILKQMADGK